MISTCTIDGKPELYGVGIRVSFYLIWFGITLARWIRDPTLFLLLLGTHFVFATSVFLGLLITMTTTTTTSLTAAEIYLVMVLVSGLPCYVRVPYYAWRSATAFKEDLDSGCYYYHLGMRNIPPSDRTGPYMFGAFETGLMACLVGMQLWFWCAGVDDGSLYVGEREGQGGGGECALLQQSGFVFRPADLQSPGYRAFNAILIFAVAGGTFVTALADAGWIVSRGGEEGEDEGGGEEVSGGRRGRRRRRRERQRQRQRRGRRRSGRRRVVRMRYYLPTPSIFFHVLLLLGASFYLLGIENRLLFVGHLWLRLRSING
jgi:hypothetical protein